VSSSNSNYSSKSSKWKSELEKVWRDLGVPLFAEQIGIDFEASFLQPLRNSAAEKNPYQDYYWTFFRLDRLPPGVLHAAPLDPVKRNGGAPALWEEWFIEGTEIHHHSMHNHADAPANLPAGQSLIKWRSPENDKEHPIEVLDVDWHYFNDADTRPYLLR